MKIFEFFFFPVSGSESYKDALGFHTNYFVNNGGFLWGLLIALGVAVLIALLFYFVLCKNYNFAKKANWWIASAIVAVIAYFVADLAVIGGQGSTSPSTFYGANELLVKKNHTKPNAKQYARLKLKIEGELQKQKDVRVPFDLTCAGWSWLIFMGFSLCVKRYSDHATQIPF